MADERTPIASVEQVDTIEAQLQTITSPSTEATVAIRMIDTLHTQGPEAAMKVVTSTQDESSSPGSISQEQLTDPDGLMATMQSTMDSSRRPENANRMSDEVMFGKIDPETGNVAEVMTATEYANQSKSEVASDTDGEYADQLEAFLDLQSEDQVATTEIGEVQTEMTEGQAESIENEVKEDFYPLNEYSALRARVASGELKFSKNEKGMLQVEDLNGEVVQEITPNESFQYNFQKASVVGENRRAQLEAMSPAEQEHAILETRLKSGELRVVPASRNEDGRVTELKVINTLTNKDFKPRLSREELADGSLMRAQAEYEQDLRQYEAENLKVEDAPEGVAVQNISSEGETVEARSEDTASSETAGDSSEVSSTRAQEIISSTESIKNFENLSLQEQLAIMNQFKELVQILMNRAEANKDTVQQMLLEVVMRQVDSQIEQIEQQIKEQDEATAEAESVAEVEAKVETPMQKYSVQLKNLADMPIEKQMGFLSEVMGDFFEASSNTESSAAQKARSELFTIMMEIFKALFNIETQAKKQTETSPKAATATSEESPETRLGTEDGNGTADPIQPVSAGVYVNTENDEPITQGELVEINNSEAPTNENEPITLSPELEAFHSAVTGGEDSPEIQPADEAENIVNSVFDNEVPEDPLEAYQQASTYDVEKNS